jgi:Chaperone of endosialidase
MALVLKDRVKVTSTTTGTGTLTLAGAATGYQSFAAIGDGNTTYYAITDPATGDWEVGIGTYTSSGTTLSRATILSSSNAGSVVDLQAGTKEVFCVYPAEKAIYEEANGDTLINGGPITVVGSGVTTIPSLTAELGKFIGNIDSFAQIYLLNQSTGTTASSDFVAYNDDTTDGDNFFTDMGMNGSNYTSIDYPIFTPNSGYIFHDGDDFFIGNQTANKDIVLFAGGADTTDEAVRISGTDRSVTTDADVTVGGELDVTGAATFNSTVTLDADPATALEAATKQYVDNLVAAGIHFHDPVVYATAAALPNSPTYNNGTAGVGATLTANANAALLIDGVTLTSPTDNGIRVLVQNESNAAHNGAYVVTEAGSGSAAWVLTRSSDADTYEIASPSGLSEGSTFYVEAGSTNAGSTFSCNTTGTITFGTTAITFTLISSALTYVGGTNINVSGLTISLTGTVAATNGGTGTNTVTTGDLLYGSATNTWSKLPIGSGYKSLLVNAGGTQVEWNAVALDQSAAVSGSLGATNGGTGQTTYTTGDILYSSATNTLAKLAGNTTITPKYLRQVGTGAVSQAPTWETLDAGDVTSGTLAVARGGTNLGSYTTGDLIYASGTTTLAALADIATGNVLLSGGAGVAPSYGKVVFGTHTSGINSVSEGGTGVATLTGLAYGNGTAAFSAATASEVVTVIGTTAVTNATNATNATTAASCSGNAATATVLETARNINGTSFNGSADITVTANTTNTLTRGTYLTGNNFNGSAATTWAVDATDANTVSKVVARDGSGNFAAGTITATLSGNATTATTATTANATAAALTAGTFLTSGGTFNGSTARTFAVDATNANTASKVVARDASGNFSAGTITAALTGNVTGNVTGSSGSCTGNAATATTLQTARTINGTSFNGSANITITAAATNVNTQLASLGVGTASSGTAGEIRATNNITAYFSDERLKTKTGNIENALDKVCQIETMLYHANETAVALGYDASIQEVGVTAQSVQKVQPEIVVPAPIDDRYLTVRYEKLVPLLIEAIKELKAQVAELKAK